MPHFYTQRRLNLLSEGGWTGLAFILALLMTGLSLPLDQGAIGSGRGGLLALIALGLAQISHCFFDHIAGWQSPAPAAAGKPTATE